MEGGGSQVTGLVLLNLVVVYFNEVYHDVHHSEHMLQSTEWYIFRMFHCCPPSTPFQQTIRLAYRCDDDDLPGPTSGAGRAHCRIGQARGQGFHPRRSVKPKDERNGNSFAVSAPLSVQISFWCSVCRSAVCDRDDVSEQLYAKCQVSISGFRQLSFWFCA